MSYISKSNQINESFPKKKVFRNSLKKRPSDGFQDDLALDCINPFSEQLTPWHESSKLESSINLLKKQVENKNIDKQIHDQTAGEVSVQHIVEKSNLQYANLAFPTVQSSQNPTSISRYYCPRLKVSSHQVIVSKNQKQQAKRFLFPKRPLNQNKNVKKISSLTIEWDEDIVYNPQKKYFEEQNLKRKILREFSQTRNQNRNNQKSIDPLKSEQKVFKLEFKNNKIHKKEISVFQFKKKENSSILDKNKLDDNQKQYQLSEFLSIRKSKGRNQNNVVPETVQKDTEESNLKLVKLSKQPQCLSRQKSNIYKSQKWKFRTSLKTRRNLSPQKSTRKQSYDRPGTLKQRTQIKHQQQSLNKVTLELGQNLKQKNVVPFHMFSKTSPLFWKKTLQ